MTAVRVALRAVGQVSRLRRLDLGRSHQCDRQRKPRRAAQGRDAAAGLNRVAGLAGALAERGDGRVEVGADEGEPPEEGGPFRPSPALDRLRWLLDDLEDHRAEAEERLPRRTGGSRLLADSTQVEAGALQR